jgi:hypothetical protein
MTAVLDERTQAAVLGGMKSVVAEPNSDASLGGQLIDATATLFFDNPIGDEAADVAPVTPDALARAVGGRSEVADVAAELVALAAVVDGALDPARLEVALEYAEYLGVKTPWMSELASIAAGRMDEAMALMVVTNAATFPGLAEPGGAPNLQPYDGKSEADKQLHARYEALEGYPDESLGRRLWVHFRRHGFRWPGQEGAFAEAFSIRHDSIHVLSDYDTSIQGELLVSTYTGRMHRTDALAAHLLPVIVQWHVGQEVNGIGAQHGALDPSKFIVAWKRGAETQVDVLSADWHFFEAAEKPLLELRSAYGIPELTEQFRAAGPEVNVTSEADPNVS